MLILENAKGGICFPGILGGISFFLFTGKIYGFHARTCGKLTKLEVDFVVKLTQPQ